MVVSTEAANDKVGAVALNWETSRPLFPGSPSDHALDASRGFAPSLLQKPDGRLRMGYAGDDGSTCRLIEAVQQPGALWQQASLSIDAGMWGETDADCVESPSVVVTPGLWSTDYGESE
jgi:hypothetical protein